MRKTNPFSHALRISRLEVKLLEAQQELYEIMIQDDYWPKVAEAYAKRPSLEEALQDQLTDDVRQLVNAFTNQILQIQREMGLARNVSTLED